MASFGMSAADALARALVGTALMPAAARPQEQGLGLEGTDANRPGRYSFNPGLMGLGFPTKQMPKRAGTYSLTATAGGIMQTVTYAAK